MIAKSVKAGMHFIRRQSGVLALVALLFATCQAGRVATALWHGVGLHGDYLETYAFKPYVLMPVWGTFLQAVTAAVVGSALLFVAIREQKRALSNMRFSRRHAASSRR